MHYFSPDRPRLGNGAQQLLNGPSAVPCLYIEPHEDGGWQVTVMVQTHEKGHSNRHTIVQSLDALCARWLEDPEAVLREDFKWNGWAEGTSQANELSLEDLL